MSANQSNLELKGVDYYFNGQFVIVIHIKSPFPQRDPEPGLKVLIRAGISRLFVAPLEHRQKGFSSGRFYPLHKFLGNCSIH